MTRKLYNFEILEVESANNIYGGERMKRNKLLLVLLLFITSISLTACGKPSPASLGITKPKIGSCIPVSNNGLAVYGTGKIDADKTIRIEIDSSQLPKIKEGYKVTLDSAELKIGLDGKVKSLPDASTIGDSSKCTIEAALEDDGGSNPNVYENVLMDATISLPARDGVWVVDKRCINDGNNDKQYVWVSKKNPSEAKATDDIWELAEVKTGDTDGTRIEVIEGLKGFNTIFLRMVDWENTLNK